jgi:acetoacetate decarboxylase
MNRSEILKTPSMPAMAPSYPHGPFRFINREYLLITFESDSSVIRSALPEPLELARDNLVIYEFMKMPDSSGFGDYCESGIVIPCLYKGEEVNFTAQMYLDDEPPITGGREIWGFPKKYGQPRLSVNKDTLTGTLDYAGERVAMGTMAYKHHNLLAEENGSENILKKLSKRQFNLKLIPNVDGSGLQIAELISYQLTDIVLKGAWSGAARLSLLPHVNAPVADFPVKRIVGGAHIIADLTLPYGRVEVDYLKS